MRGRAREAVVMRGGDWRVRVYARREAGDSGRAFARRAPRSRGRVRSEGGCRRGSQGSGVQPAAKKAWSTETCRLAIWDQDWAVTSASCSSRVVRVAPGWGRMPWNGFRGGEGSRRTVRVEEVMEGEEETAARET